MTDDDFETQAALYLFVSGPIGKTQPPAVRGTLLDLVRTAVRLPIDARESLRIAVDGGAHLGWNQIASMAEQNRIS